MSSILGYDMESDNDSFPVNLVPRREYGNIDVQKAIHEEINKYKSFNAFEEVLDEGQDSLPVRHCKKALWNRMSQMGCI